MFKEGALMTRVNDGFGTIAHRTAQRRCALRGRYEEDDFAFVLYF